MICLNDAFAGKLPGVMDAKFPKTDWRLRLADSRGEKDDWGWFWAGFAPHGMLMNAPQEAREEGGRQVVWTREEMAPEVLKACAEGLLESREPTAFYRQPDGQTMYYWIFSGPDGETRPGDAKAVSV